jgi:hypothetical protein
MPSDVAPTIRLVLDSLQRGFCDSPSMYTVARMNATMKVKKAMPTIASFNGRDRTSVRSDSASGP